MLAEILAVKVKTMAASFAIQVQSQSYGFRSISFTFTDPRVHMLLRPAVEGDERLLRLYETGLQVCGQHTAEPCLSRSQCPLHVALCS